MRTWSAGHPKAKLLKRKREAILTAARRQFLATGYDATTMEAIAAAAGVSIMTLYRHAESKDDLFEAVVKIECDPTEADAGMEGLKQMPLRQALVLVGEVILKEVLAPDRIAVLRAVIAESVRFPHLGDIAYRGVVDHAARVVATVLRSHPETVASAAAIERASRDFVERLIGGQTLRLLLGAPADDGLSAADRAAVAADGLVAALSAPPVTRRRARGPRIAAL